MSKMNPTMSRFSSMLMPAIGSSSISSSGSIASTRPSSMRFCTPYGNEPTGSLRKRAMSSSSMTDSTNSRAATSSLRIREHERATAEHARPLVREPAEHEVVEHAHLRERAEVLERAPDAEAGDLVRPQPGELLLGPGAGPERDRASGAVRYTPVTALTSVVLPAPLGPMSANSSPRSHVERHVRHRGEAAEPDGRSVHLEDRLGRRGGDRPSPVGVIAATAAAGAPRPGSRWCPRRHRGTDPAPRCPRAAGAGPVDDHPAQLEHVAVMRVLHRQARVLLDDEHADAVRGHLAQQLEQLRHHHRGEAERQLVAHQVRRLGHQGAADGDHLLLATRQVSGGLLAPLGEAWEQLVDPPVSLADRRSIATRGRAAQAGSPPR